MQWCKITDLFSNEMVNPFSQNYEDGTGNTIAETSRNRPKN